jgi:hypothetical protein
MGLFFGQDLLRCALYETEGSDTIQRGSKWVTSGVVESQVPFLRTEVVYGWSWIMIVTKICRNRGKSGTERGFRVHCPVMVRGTVILCAMTEKI